VLEARTAGGDDTVIVLGTGLNLTATEVAVQLSQGAKACELKRNQTVSEARANTETSALLREANSRTGQDPFSLVESLLSEESLAPYKAEADSRARTHRLARFCDYSDAGRACKQNTEKFSISRKCLFYRQFWHPSRPKKRAASWRN
jgi:hypothetical protein